MKKQYANFPAFGRDFKKTSLLFLMSCPLLLSCTLLLSCFSLFSCPSLLSRKESLFSCTKKKKAFFVGRGNKSFSFFFSSHYSVERVQHAEVCFIPRQQILYTRHSDVYSVEGMQHGEVCWVCAGPESGLRLHKSLSLGLDLSLALFLRLGEVWSLAWNWA